MEKSTTVNIFKIKETEIILQNYELGQGKIIISDLYRGSFSYYWGGMRYSLEDFLISISSDYFANNLCNERYKFSGKATAKSLRRYFINEMSYAFPWYKHFKAHKQFRDVLKDIERCDNQYEALNQIESLPNEIYDFDNLDYYETQKMQQYLKDHFNNEPWHFLENEYSDEYVFLLKLHKELIKYLKKEKKNVKLI